MAYDYRIMDSSFHGNIYEIPEIFVDNFETLGKKAYFLSHCHDDHIQGLFTEKFLQYLKDTDTFIYMSEISATIIDVRSSGDYNEYIKPLKLGSTLVTIKNDDTDLYLNVSLIPAGHCLGSVMFLFNTPNKTILYTGDFRIDESDISKYNQLHKGTEPIEIDVMYIDFTFLNSDYDYFPKRSETVAYVIDEIRTWLDDDKCNNRFVALKTPARYAYEFTLIQIYERLNLKTFVRDDAWKLYSKFPELREVVTRNSDSKIHLCSDTFYKYEHAYCEIDTNNKMFLCVNFSAKRWKSYNIEQKMVEKYENVVNVCFATHCSRSELRAFVNYFAPTKLIGFADRDAIPADLEGTNNFKDTFIRSPSKQVVGEREGVRKVPADVLRKMFDE